jgi:hypothetical protein
MLAVDKPTLEQLAKRKSNLERKQRQRAREKARSFRAMQAHLEKIKGDCMNAEGIARRTKRNQCTLGEISPGVDASTLDEALEVAREMARALSSPTYKKTRVFTISNVVSSTRGSITRGSVVHTTHPMAVEHPISTDQPGNFLPVSERTIGWNTVVASMSAGRLSRAQRKTWTSQRSRS